MAIPSTFVTFCNGDVDRPETTDTISISNKLLNGEENFIKDVCSDIRNYSLRVLNEMDKVDRTTGGVRGFDGKRDNTYDTLKQFCRIGEKCKRIYRFQRGNKQFIIQLGHIVQEFGLFLPHSINSLQYTEDIDVLAEEKERGGRYLTGFVGKRIITGDGGKIFGMTMDEFINNKNTSSDHVQFVRPLELSILLKFSPQKSSNYSEKFQSWINDTYDRICTVLRLRYIDLRLCNKFYSPMNHVNKQHAETYESFLLLRSSFLGTVDFINDARKQINLRTYVKPEENDFSRVIPK